jgi:hypothetical protein
LEIINYLWCIKKTKKISSKDIFNQEITKIQSEEQQLHQEAFQTYQRLIHASMDEAKKQYQSQVHSQNNIRKQ